MRTITASSLLTTVLLAAGGGQVAAGAHTWDVNELFSNADGTIQFIELREANGTPNEVGVGGHNVTSNTKTFLIPSNVASPTTNKTLLFATPGFSCLPGAPTPDHVLPLGIFFSLTADTVTYVPYDSLVYGAGQLPANGVSSLNDGLVIALNTPKNYAGIGATIDARLPAVPDGSAGSTPMLVSKLDPSGSSLSVSWDATTCPCVTKRHIIYGQGSQLPTSPTGTFQLLGSECGLGASPYTWNTTPDATDATGLIWWLIVARDGANNEGSWGEKTGGAERVGPGTNGSSAQCSVTNKDPGNPCGH